MKISITKFPALILVAGCLTTGCGQRSVNQPPPIPWDSVSLVQEQKGYSLPPSLVTVDLEEDLPEFHLKMELKQHKFIPLETTPTLHLDKDRHIRYLSENYCGIVNQKRGEVFIFKLDDGKCVSYINHQGPGPIEYPTLADVVVDEKAEEVFILSYNRSMLVYSFDGKYQRRFTIPRDVPVLKIFDFDNDALLASEGIHHTKENSILNETPYLLLSKQTGEIISPLNIRPAKHSSVGGGEWVLTTPNMIKNGKDIYLSHLSSDTLYHIEQGGKLKPFLVRQPSVFGKKPQILFQVMDKMGSYMTFVKTINQIVPNSPKGYEFKHEYYVLNLETGEMFKLGVTKFLSNFDDNLSFAFDVGMISDLAANTIATLVDADILLDDLKNGKVKSDELKQVFSKLQEEDNPVLVIYKY